MSIPYPKLNFISYQQLLKDTRKIVEKIPKNKYDAVVPILRSGSIPAFIIAEKLNLPLLIEEKLFGGYRLEIDNKIKNVLLVDDSIASGRAMMEAKRKLNNYNVDCLAIYSNSRDNITNYNSRSVPHPRMFEWNMFNNLNLRHVMFDLDGVICIDPRVYDDDGDNYKNEIIDIPSLFLPKYPIHSICTNRIDRWRSITESWLQKNKVVYSNLIMQPFSTAVERRKKSNAGHYKAAHYNNSNASLFVESSKWQAEKIFQLTNKPVFCIENYTLPRP